MGTQSALAGAPEQDLSSKLQVGADEADGRRKVARVHALQVGAVDVPLDGPRSGLWQDTGSGVRSSWSQPVFASELCPLLFTSSVISDHIDVSRSAPSRPPAACSAVSFPAGAFPLEPHARPASHAIRRHAEPLLASPLAAQSSAALPSAAFFASTVAPIAAADALGPPATSTATAVLAPAPARAFVGAAQGGREGGREGGGVGVGKRIGSEGGR